MARISSPFHQNERPCSNVTTGSAALGAGGMCLSKGAVAQGLPIHFVAIQRVE